MSTSIRLAAATGDLETVSQLVPMADEETLRSALVDACANGQLPVVQLLLDLAVDHHALEEDAFGWACANGQLPVVQLLLKLGVDHHAGEECAFRRACENGHLPVVQLLLELGVDHHALGEDAFRWACEKGHLPVVQLLLQQGVSDQTVADMLDCAPVADLLRDYAQGKRTKSARSALP